MEMFDTRVKCVPGRSEDTGKMERRLEVFEITGYRQDTSN
jgi:hypothetical protein